MTSSLFIYGRPEESGGDKEKENKRAEVNGGSRSATQRGISGRYTHHLSFISPQILTRPTVREFGSKEGRHGPSLLPTVTGKHSCKCTKLSETFAHFRCCRFHWRTHTKKISTTKLCSPSKPCSLTSMEEQLKMWFRKQDEKDLGNESIDGRMKFFA